MTNPLTPARVAALRAVAVAAHDSRRRSEGFALTHHNEFVKLANPATILALIDAVESKDRLLAMMQKACEEPLGWIADELGIPDDYGAPTWAEMARDIIEWSKTGVKPKYEWIGTEIPAPKPESGEEWKNPEADSE